MSVRNRWAVGLSLLAIVVAVAVGCLPWNQPHREVTGNEAGTEMDMTAQQAAEHADTMLDATMNAIKPEVQWAHGYNFGSGSDSVHRERIVMTKISKERLGPFLGLVQRAWEKSGYQITGVNSDKDSPAVFAKSKDGFGIGLVIGEARQAHIEVDSPSVHASQVKPPTTPPNGPSYDDVEQIPRPNVHSDFWSAETPVPGKSPGS